MNTFAGNITLKWNKVIASDFEYDFIESLSKTWDKNLYIFGETEIKKSSELIKYFEEKIWELKNFDISISTEDKIELMEYDFEEWMYEMVSFEWEFIEFNEIKERFINHDAIFSIREAEISERFWNKIVRVDFVY
jgi:hypothetical protein